jgi:hypothetical protein
MTIASLWNCRIRGLRMPNSLDASKEIQKQKSNKLNHHFISGVRREGALGAEAQRFLKCSLAYCSQACG